MAACGEENLDNWITCGPTAAAYGGGIDNGDIDSEDEIIQGVKRELSDKYSSVEERMARVEKLLSSRQLSKKSSGITQSRSPPAIDKAAPVVANAYDSDTSDMETRSWDVVQIKPVGDDLSTLTSSKRCCGGKCWRWVCLALVVCSLIAVAVAVPLLLKRKDERSSNVAAGTIVGSPTNAFTLAPTVAPANQLPPECEPLSDDVDICLSVELDQDTADFCVDCVWRFLPDRTGYCESLEESVCNIVRSCGCSSCQDALVSYLDCQTDCEFDCST